MKLLWSNQNELVTYFFSYFRILAWKELSGMPYVEMGWGRRGSVT